MKIPSKLKIGNLTYSVTNMSDEESTDKDSFGIGWQTKQIIKIGAALSQEKREETLLHEVIHQVLDQSGFFEESKDEKMVKILANGMYQVLRDNNLLK